jgi:hypothetical protein
MAIKKVSFPIQNGGFFHRFLGLFTRGVTINALETVKIKQES